MASEQESSGRLRPHPQLAASYSDPAGRLAFARDLFNGTARYYDAVNRWFSLGTGSWYRRTCLETAGLKPRHRVIDVWRFERRTEFDLFHAYRGCKL